jgi:hypothetical protein
MAPIDRLPTDMQVSILQCLNHHEWYLLARTTRSWTKAAQLPAAARFLPPLLSHKFERHRTAFATSRFTQHMRWSLTLMLSCDCNSRRGNWHQCLQQRRQNIVSLYIDVNSDKSDLSSTTIECLQCTEILQQETFPRVRSIAFTGDLPLLHLILDDRFASRFPSLCRLNVSSDPGRTNVNWIDCDTSLARSLNDPVLLQQIETVRIYDGPSREPRWSKTVEVLQQATHLHSLDISSASIALPYGQSDHLVSISAAMFHEIPGEEITKYTVVGIPSSLVCDYAYGDLDISTVVGYAPLAKEIASILQALQYNERLQSINVPLYAYCRVCTRQGHCKECAALYTEAIPNFLHTFPTRNVTIRTLSTTPVLPFILMDSMLKQLSTNENNRVVVNGQPAITFDELIDDILDEAWEAEPDLFV